MTKQVRRHLFAGGFQNHPTGIFGPDVVEGSIEDQQYPDMEADKHQSVEKNRPLGRKEVQLYMHYLAICDLGESDL